MLENLTVKNSSTFELTLSSVEEARDVKEKFEQAKYREAGKGSTGFPTNFEITRTNTVVQIYGRDIIEALYIARHAGFLSEPKLIELEGLITTLRSEEKLANQAASRSAGIYANRAIHGSVPREGKAHIEFTPRALEILQQQQSHTIKIK